MKLIREQIDYKAHVYVVELETSEDLVKLLIAVKEALKRIEENEKKEPSVTAVKI
jgi:hypothetical protein